MGRTRRVWDTTGRRGQPRQGAHQILAARQASRIKKHPGGNPGRDGYGAVCGEPETRRPAPNERFVHARATAEPTPESEAWRGDNGPLVITRG